MRGLYLSSWHKTIMGGYIPTHKNTVYEQSTYKTLQVGMHLIINKLLWYSLKATNLYPAMLPDSGAKICNVELNFKIL